MTDAPARLTRQALYDRLWITPANALAKELGLSISTLTTACQRHEIPTPRAGYWSKKAHGKPVEQPPLEDSGGMNALTEVSFAKPKAKLARPRLEPPAPPLPAPKVTAAPPSAVVSPAPKEEPTVAPAAAFDLHPDLRLTRKQLLAAKPIDGLSRVSGKGVFAVSVSPELAHGALAFLDALLRNIEAQGWSVLQTEKGLQLQPEGEAISFTLAEQTDRVPHRITEAERQAQERFEARRAAAQRRGQWSFESGPTIAVWDYRPTGRLVFQLEPNPYTHGVAAGLRRTFTQSRDRPLGDQMDKIVATLAARAAAKKEIRLITAAREAEWAAQVARRQDFERRQRLEARRSEFLDSQLERHETVRRLEGFLARYADQDLQDDPVVIKFITWTRGRLARLEADLTPEALGQRFAKANLDDDEADIPSWTKFDM